MRMRKLILAMPILALLPSCTGEDVNAFTVKVIDGAIAACDWVPTVATVAALFNQGEVKMVADAVTIVCEHRPKPGATPTGTPPMYKGIPMTGHAVRK